MDCRKVRRLIVSLAAVCLLLLLCCAALADGGLGWLVSTASNVNVRSGNGTSYDVIDHIPSAGTRVQYFAKMKADGVTWYYIQWNGAYGWVSGSNFTTEGTQAATTSAPTQTPASATPTPTEVLTLQLENRASVPTPTATPVATPDTTSVRGYVVSAADGETIYRQPSYSAVKVDTVKGKGTLLAWYTTVRSENTAWYYVIDGKNKGWVSGDRFSTTLPTEVPAPEPMGYVRSKAENQVLRDSASTSGKRLLQFSEADTVLAYYGTKDKDSWYYVLYGDTYGWVKASGFAPVQQSGAVATTTPKPTATAAATERPVLGYVKTTAGSVNMRIRPSKDAGRVASVSKGKSLPYYDIQ